MTGTGASSSSRVDEALRPVAISTTDVRKLLKDLTDDGDLYLVGSLAAGLGNRGSDVDIQIFVDSDDFTSTPMMFFVERVVVDVQYFKLGSPASLVPLDCPTADIAGGPCALGAPPTRSRRSPCLGGRPPCRSTMARRRCSRTPSSRSSERW